MKSLKQITNNCLSFLLLVLPLFSQSNALHGQNITTSLMAERIPVDTMVRIGKLGNGFTYYLRNHNKPEGKIWIGLGVKAGSNDEDEDQFGAAHLTEHMNFNGIPAFPDKTLKHFFAVSRIEKEVNAHTYADKTIFSLSIPADDPALFKNCLTIVKGWAQEALLETAQIESEKKVVIEEMRMRNDAYFRMSSQFLPIVTNGSKGGTWPSIGTEASVSNLDPDALRRFYKDWYRPDLQALVIVGNLNIDKTEEQIKRLFSRLELPEKPRGKIKLEPTLSGDNHYITAWDPQAVDDLRLTVYMKHKSFEVKTTADYGRILMSQLYSRMMQERLWKIQSGLNSPFFSMLSDRQKILDGVPFDALITEVLPKPQNLETAFKRMMFELERADRFGFTGAEIERAKNGLLTPPEEPISQTLGGLCFDHFFYSRPIPSAEKMYETRKQLLTTITVQRMNAFVSDIITDINRDIVVQSRDPGLLPAETTINEWLKEVQSSEIQPLAQDTIEMQPPFAPPAATGSALLSKHEINEIGLTELILKNGVKIILKPTATGDGEILMQAFRPGGASVYSGRDYHLAFKTPEVITNGGVRSYSKAQVGRYFGSSGISLNPYVYRNEEGFIGSSTSGDLTPMVQLIYLYLTEPKKDLPGFVSRLAHWNKQNSEAPALEDPHVTATIGQLPAVKESNEIPILQKEDFERIYNIYEERFMAVSGFTFIFAGDFKVEETLEPILKYLGSLPFHKKAVVTQAQAFKSQGKRTIKRHVQGTGGTAHVKIYFSDVYHFDETNNIKLDALQIMLGHRLKHRLRETEGGTYHVDVGLTYNRLPEPKFQFQVEFKCAPQNAEQLLSQVYEEISLLKKKAQDVSIVKKIISSQHTSDNRSWLQYLEKQYRNQADPTSILRRPQLSEAAITPRKMKSASTNYLNENKSVSIISLPEN